MSIRQKGAAFAGAYFNDERSCRAFAVAMAPPEGKSYAPDKVVDVLHTKLELGFDLERRAVAGTATHTVTPILAGVGTLLLDCCELKVHEVTDGRGKALAFDHDGARLTIRFPKPLAKGSKSQVAIAYSGTPRSGLYFTGPSEAYPHTARQVWSQGQDEDSRFWFPCFDYPNERATSETLVTVPESWTVVGNGKLLAVKHDRAKKTRTFHHREATPHVSYLLSIACGEFAKVEDRWRGMPVQYFVKPVRGSQGPAHVRADPRHDGALLANLRRGLPLREVQPGGGRGLHLRRHGEHLRHDAHRPLPHGRARRARLRAPGPREPRARPPVVRRSPDLQGLVARLAQRGLRHLQRGGLPRALARPTRTPTSTGSHRCRPTSTGTAPSAGPS